MKKLTLTIGIPAFNEEANIKFLLKDILKQKADTFVLKKILVISDGSTDNTIEEAKKIKNSSIVCIGRPTNKGQGHRLNEIRKKADSDILVLFDADIALKDERCIERLIQPIIQKRADLTSIRVEELPSETFIGKILASSMKFKKFVFEQYKKGGNIYTCHGRARAFSRRYYSQVTLSTSIGEDAYSYLACISRGYQYHFVSNTSVYYKLPQTLSDHTKQSVRFLKSKKRYVNTFGKEFVAQQYYLPSSVLLKSAAIFLVKTPLHMMSYLVLQLWISLYETHRTSIKDAWEISKSSKTLNRMSALIAFIHSEVK